MRAHRHANARADSRRVRPTARDTFRDSDAVGLFDLLEELPDLAGTETAVTTERADRGDLAGASPTGDRLRVHAEHGRYFGWRQQGFVVVGFHGLLHFRRDSSFVLGDSLLIVRACEELPSPYPTSKCSLDVRVYQNGTSGKIGQTFGIREKFVHLHPEAASGFHAAA